MATDDLVWTVEEACQNACPSPRQILLNGWLLRASGGPTRRTNSVNPLRSGPRKPTSIIAAAEEIYDSLGQPTIFRVPSIVPEMEGPLERQGYAAQAETCTLFIDFCGDIRLNRDDVALSADPREEWHAAWAALNGASDLAQRIHRNMIDSIALPRAFASRCVEGEPVAIAYGVMHERLLVVESVATHPEHRQRGYATQTVRHLMDWGIRNGARGGCVQVVADNLPACALYRALGFEAELYRYHYRRKDVVGQGQQAVVLG